MSAIKNGGPAFPVDTRGSGDTEDAGSFGHQTSNVTWQYPGMTLRDYAAIHTDMGKLGVNSMDAAIEIVGRPFPDVALDQAAWQFELAWKLRFMSADAMLAAREVQS